jgi:hypothetical protein
MECLLKRLQCSDRSQASLALDTALVSMLHTALQAHTAAQAGTVLLEDTVAQADTAQRIEAHTALVDTALAGRLAQRDILERRVEHKPWDRL